MFGMLSPNIAKQWGCGMTEFILWLRDWRDVILFWLNGAAFLFSLVAVVGVFFWLRHDRRREELERKYCGGNNGSSSRGEGNNERK